MRFKSLKLHSLFSNKQSFELTHVQYLFQWQNQPINSLIEGAIVEAEQKGCKVLTLGLLNQVIIDSFLHKYLIIINKFSVQLNANKKLEIAGGGAEHIWRAICSKEP